MSLLVVVRNDARAEALLRWASCFTDGNFEELYVLDCRESKHHVTSKWKKIDDENFPNVSYGGVLKELDDKERIEIHYLSVKSPDAYETVMAEQRSLKPKFLLLDRNLIEDSDFEVKYIERLLNDVNCTVMVVRLGGTDGTNNKVLVPCAGGPHSRYALKIIHRAANVEPTAFFVEPDADEVSLDVGYNRLGKIISGAGIKADDIDKKAVISEHVSQSISSEVSEGAYGMLLLGATDRSTLRRKLFGTISDGLLKERDGTAVAVIRAERPMGYRLKDAFEQFLSVRTPQLTRDDRVALFTDIEEKSRWSFDFAALMILATAIAALGLLADSGAVVIGAMLVAPLMTPLLGGGLALVQGNWPLWKQCQKAVLFGFFSALAIGALCGIGANWFGMHLTSELAARGNPTALDLGVAFVSGLAASYCLARPKLSGALAGVAIAAALVPPIATTGICMMLGELDVVRGSALLFGTNVVAIVFGAALNFYVTGIRGRGGVSGIWSRRLFIVIALVCVGLAVPLTSSLIGSIAGERGSLQGLNAAVKGSSRVVAIRVEGYAEGRKKLHVIVESQQPMTSKQKLEVLGAVKKHYKGQVILRLENRLISEL